MEIQETLIDGAALAGGLLVARLVLGLAMAAHGGQKLFGWFGGHGLEGTGAFFAQLGFRPGRLFALAAGATELGGGLLTAAGLLGPVGPALVLLTMVVAMATVHVANGFFAGDGGVELPLTYAAGALALAFAGPGAFSLDTLLGMGGAWSPQDIWVVIAAALAAALVNLLLRDSRQPQAAGAR